MFGLFLIVLMAPSSAVPTAVRGQQDTPVPHLSTSPSSNVLKVKLPYTVESIAVGRTQIGTGIGYIHDGVFHFKNLVNSTEYSIGTSTTGTVLHKTLTGADVDDDGYTEFLVMFSNGTGPYLLLINCDNDTLRTYACNVTQAFEVFTGDFDGDSMCDAAVYSHDLIQTVDLNSGAAIGFYDADGQINRAFAGNFTSSPRHEIGLVHTYQSEMRITIINGTGLVIGSTTVSDNIGTDGIRYDGPDVLDCIAVTSVDTSGDSHSRLRTYSSSLSLLFERDLEPETNMTLRAGQLNGDADEDLVCVPAKSSNIIFVDGATGDNLVRSVDMCPGSTTRGFDAAALDADNNTDVALEGPRGQLSIIRGLDGSTGYEEPRFAGPFTQVITYDFNVDGRSDVAVLSSYIGVLLSDTQPPDVTVHPLSPQHPTIYDSYVKFEITALDESKIDRATIFISPVSGVVQADHAESEMVPSSDNRFYYLMTNMEPGVQSYYIEVVDQYLNTYRYGNVSSPHQYVVEGHFASHADYNATIDEARLHVLAVSDESFGDDIMAGIVTHTPSQQAVVHVHYTNGTHISDINVTGAWDKDAFEVYFAHIDGDAIRDPIVMATNKSMTFMWAYHGTNYTLWRTLQLPARPMMSSRMLQVFDDDGDQTEELHFVVANRTARYLFRVDDQFSLNTTTVAGNASLVGTSHAVLSGEHPEIALLWDSGAIDLYEANTLSLYRHLDYASPGGAVGDTPLVVLPFRNGSTEANTLAAVFHSWSGDTPVNYICMIGDTTMVVGSGPVYTWSGSHATRVFTYDADADNTDELLLLDESGYLTMIAPSSGGNTVWSRYVSDAEPVSGAVLDFDGDEACELVLSTSDNFLYAVGMDGSIDCDAEIGVLYNLIPVDSVDAGAGTDIATFPVFRARHTFGVVRNIDLLYGLDVDVGLSASVVVQGSVVSADITVTNAYDEVVADSSVTVTAYYLQSGSVSSQVFGLVYDAPSGNYTGDIPCNWPIGLVNLTVSVLHSHYTDVAIELPGAVEVHSPLTVSVFSESEVLQTESLHINVSVSDSFGSQISDANVTVLFDGHEYPAAPSSSGYYTVIDNVTVAPGHHTLLVRAEHRFAVGPANATRVVSVVASELVIARESPVVVDQYSVFTTWLNITDPFDNAIVNATVRVEVAGTELRLDEVAPGAYFLNDTADFPIGNYTVEVFVTHPFVDGTSFGSYHMAVRGALDPGVTYDDVVTAGTDFSVSVLLYDEFEEVPSGGWVKVEVNGVNFTASHVGGAEYRVNVTANYTIGPQSFKVYAGATLAYDYVEAFDIEVFSQASVTLTVTPGWTIAQGEELHMVVNVTDWYGEVVSDATVTAVSPESLSFQNRPTGDYNVTLDTTGYSPGQYLVVVSVEHYYLFSHTVSVNLTVLGWAEATVDIPDVVLNHMTTTINLTVTDIYGNPLSTFNYSLVLGGTISTSGTSNSYSLSWTFQPDLPPGEHVLNMSFVGDYVYLSLQTTTIRVLGMSNVSFVSPAPSVTVAQGDAVNFTLVLRDLAGYLVTGATVHVSLNGGTYFLDEVGDGVYSGLVATVGLPLRTYNYTVSVEHEFMAEWATTGELLLQGTPTVSLVTDPSPLRNTEPAQFKFTVTDQYGSPVNGFSYTIAFGDSITVSGTSDDYVLVWGWTPAVAPGVYDLSLTVSGPHVATVNSSWTVHVYSTANVTVVSPAQGSVTAQGTSVPFIVNVTDGIGDLIAGVNCTIHLHGSSYRLVAVSPGVYALDISTVGLPLGTYSVRLTVVHSHLYAVEQYLELVVTGHATISVEYGTPVRVGDVVTFTVVATDLYMNPVTEFNWTLTFQGQVLSGHHSGSNTLSVTLPVSGPPREYPLVVQLSGRYVVPSDYHTTVGVRSEAVVSVVSPSNSTEFVQGEDSIHFVVNLFDTAGNPVPNISVSIVIRDSMSNLDGLDNGTFVTTLSTVGWQPGQYEYMVVIAHPLVDYSHTVQGLIIVKGQPVLVVELSPETPVQGDTVAVTVWATDLYGEPLSNLSITVSFQDQVLNATETSTAGKYVAVFTLPAEGHGTYDIHVSASGTVCEPGSTVEAVYIGVRPPEISMSPETFTLGSGLSFLISLVGFLIYFKVSSSISARGTGKDLHRSIRRMDIIYVSIVALAGLVLLHSVLSAEAGQYSLAVAESVLLLGISVLLYGIWLYRDANSAILDTGHVSTRRMVFGLWHLVFVPLVVLQIFAWGKHIEWFEYYVLREAFTVGGVAVPTIMLTVFVTYVSSIVVVVVNLYKELSRSIAKLDHMRESGTPASVLEEERMDLVDKTGSSIRIKFFMFLVVLAGTTVSTMDFLRSYALGVIVLMPVLFLVVIPFVTSKILKAADRATGYLRKHQSPTSLQEIADAGVTVEHQPDDQTQGRPTEDGHSDTGRAFAATSDGPHHDAAGAPDHTGRPSDGSPDDSYSYSDDDSYTDSHSYSDSDSYSDGNSDHSRGPGDDHDY